jgi:hypothetical protein
MGVVSLQPPMRWRVDCSDNEVVNIVVPLFHCLWGSTRAQRVVEERAPLPAHPQNQQPVASLPLWWLKAIVVW